MDSITFEVEGMTIQLVHGDVLFWKGRTDLEPDIVMSVDRLQDVLSTARMIRKQGSES